MNKTFLQLIYLVDRVLKNETGELNKELFTDLQDIEMWKQLYNLAVAQEVQVFLYESVKEFDIPKEARDKLYSAYNRAVRKEAVMHLEVERYFEELEKANITYLPIKGWKFKHLYRKPYLRTMTDVDVIIREDGFEKACLIAKECGFELDNEGINHHVFVKKPITELEVHHRLFADTSVFHQWGTDILEKNGDFTISDEDAYVYLIAHMAKHFTSDGAGMRNMIDGYLYNKHYAFNESQSEYIKKTLRELKLDIFEARIRHLCEVWFDGAEYDENSLELTEYVMDGGLYGKAGNRASLVIGNNDTGKIRWFLGELFPSFERTKQSLKYKRMYKILTPVYWIIRIFKGVGKKGVVSSRTVVMTKNEEDFDRSRKILDYVGLEAIKY